MGFLFCPLRILSFVLCGLCVCVCVNVRDCSARGTKSLLWYKNGKQRQRKRDEGDSSCGILCVCVCVSEKRKTTESTKRKSLPLLSVYPDDYRALKVSLTTVRDGSLSFSSSPPKIPFNSFASFMKFPRLFRTNQTIHTKYFDYTLNAILFLVIFWMHRG